MDEELLLPPSEMSISDISDSILDLSLSPIRKPLSQPTPSSQPTPPSQPSSQPTPSSQPPSQPTPAFQSILSQLTNLPSRPPPGFNFPEVAPVTLEGVTYVPVWVPNTKVKQAPETACKEVSSALEKDSPKAKQTKWVSEPMYTDVRLKDKRVITSSPQMVRPKESASSTSAQGPPPAHFGKTTVLRPELEPLQSIPPLLGMRVKPTGDFLAKLESEPVSTTPVGSDSFESQRPKKRCYPCLLCGQRVSRLKTHVVQCHLPYYVCAPTACFSCKKNVGTVSRLARHLEEHFKSTGHAEQLELGCRFDEGGWIACQLISGLLHAIARSLGLTTIAELLNVEVLKDAKASEGQWDNMVAEGGDRLLVEMFSKFMGEKKPRSITLLPPNCLGALAHWRPVYALLSLVPGFKPMEIHEELSPQGTPRPMGVGGAKEIPLFADAHVHLDTFQQRTKHYQPLRQLRSEPCCPTHLGQLTFFVANNSFLKKNELDWPLQPKDVSDPAARLAYSVHPKTAGELSDSEMACIEQKLRELIRNPRVVAMAEIGLDFAQQSSTSLQAMQQLKAFKLQLRIAKQVGKPVTIHIRDSMFRQEATFLGMKVLSQELPRDYAVYLHCFLGTQEQLEDWTRRFDNLFVGIGPKAMRDEAFRQVLREIPMERIVLETDAPLQVPPTVRGYQATKHPLVGNPFMCLDVARYIADVKAMPFRDVCAKTLYNSRTLFSTR